jgi:hypothetical protein
MSNVECRKFCNVSANIQLPSSGIVSLDEVTTCFRKGGDKIFLESIWSRRESPVLKMVIAMPAETFKILQRFTRRIRRSWSHTLTLSIFRVCFCISVKLIQNITIESRKAHNVHSGKIPWCVISNGKQTGGNVMYKSGDKNPYRRIALNDSEDNFPTVSSYAKSVHAFV